MSNRPHSQVSNRPHTNQLVSLLRWSIKGMRKEHIYIYIYICYGPIYNLTCFKAGRQLWSQSTGLKAGWPNSWLNWFADLLQNREVSWRHGWERERCHTVRVYTCTYCSNSTAVLVLDKAKPWSPQELWLSTRTAPVCWDHQRVTEPAEYVLYML